MKDRKMYDILNENCGALQKGFRESCIQKYAATEYALICRYIKGEKTLVPNKDFSQYNLWLIDKLSN